MICRCDPPSPREDNEEVCTTCGGTIKDEPVQVAWATWAKTQYLDRFSILAARRAFFAGYAAATAAAGQRGGSEA